MQHFQYCTFVGDPHGHTSIVTQAYSYAVQNKQLAVGLGDFCPKDQNYGFLDPYSKNHDLIKSIFGNHDHTNILSKPTVVKNYTTLKHNGGIHLLSGGYSINRKSCLEKGYYWNPLEELDYCTLSAAVNSYHTYKPDILVAHEPCTSAIEVMRLNEMGVLANALFEPRSITSQAVERMYKLHKPRLVVNGHWHVDAHYYDGYTHFLSVAMRQVVRVNLDSIYSNHIELDYLTI
jgi:hypothetical protein